MVRPPPAQRALMGGGVDAERQAAGDGQAGTGQMSGEMVGGFPAERGRVAGADDGELRCSQTVGVAVDEQQRRRIGDLPQQRRIAGIVQRQQVIAGLFQPGQILFHPPPVGLAQIVERRGRQIQSPHSARPAAKRRGGRTEMFQQPGKTGRSDARRPQQRQQPGRLGGRERGVTVQGVVTRSCRRMARSACITSA